MGVAEAALRVRELPGGVSNAVYWVETERGGSLVFKQSLERLRVEQEWRCPRERIFREIDALTLLGPRAPEGSLPRVLFADREYFCFAMTAAEPGARTWKEELLDGRVDLDLARQAARLQAAFFHSADLAERFGGLELFEQLRLDPYYRATAEKHPDLREHFMAAIELASRPGYALTHGDWSPKNFLLNSGPQLFSIDYEVMHWGDASFDVAFLLNHFLLKGWHRPAQQEKYRALAATYWDELRQLVGEAAAGREAAVLRHLGCLHLARVDGKSPVEYLSGGTRAKVRQFARRLIVDPPGTVDEAFGRQSEEMHEPLFDCANPGA